jgi:hypothetical protein
MIAKQWKQLKSQTYEGMNKLWKSHLMDYVAVIRIKGVFFTFFVVLEFEFRTSCLLGRCITTESLQ